MKVGILIFLAMPLVSFSMEKQAKNTVGRTPKSLKEIALLKQLEPITSKTQLEDLLSKVPQDVRCDIIKKSIHKNYLTQADLLELIKKYCGNNTLLRAYTYYTHINNTNRKKNISLITALAQYEEAKGNYEIIPLLNALIKIALEPELPFSPIRLLIEQNEKNNIIQLLHLGEPVTVADLTHAISNGRAEIAYILLEWGAALDDSNKQIYFQPLFQAFRTLDESLIKTLLLNGASLMRTYQYVENKKYTIPEYLRLYIRMVQQSHQPIEGKSLEETQTYISKLMQLLDTYAPVKKFKRLSA